LKPFKFSNTPTFFSFKEPTIPEDYERIRDKQVAENQRVFEALGLNTIASEFNNNLQQSAQKKGGETGNKGTHNDDSSSSEYLVGEDDQGDSTDDDDTESIVQPNSEVLLLNLQSS
jgi:hypothetical protein